MTNLIATPPSGYHRTAVLVILVLTYAGIAAGRVPGLKLSRSGIALLGAIAVMVFGGVTTDTAVTYVNWPTIMLLFGFFVISAQLRLSGLYAKIADGIASRLGHPARFLLVLMLTTAGLSALLNNDVVCLVFTPIVAATLIRQRLNPCPFLIALAVSSNIGAAATLIGNSQNMMIGEIAHLSFGSYTLWSAAPVLFALGCAYAIIWLLSRKTIRMPFSTPETAPGPDIPFNRGHTVKGLIILAAVIALFFTSLPKEIIVLTAAGIHLASAKFRSDDLLELVDWSVLLLFIGLFVVTAAFQSTGYGEQAMRSLAHSGFDLGRPANLALTTTLLSNLINNAAAAMLLIKVVPLSHATAAYVLALANSFGGSLLIVGSVANIIVVQQARKFGLDITFRQFFRTGLPVTAAALGGLLLWVALVQ